MKVTLREYQVDIVRDLRQAYFDGFTSLLLASPTASGKTCVFTFIAESAVKRGLSIDILVHRRELIRQTSDALADLGIRHGIIAPGHSPTTDQVQIASVQTLVRRLNGKRKPDLIIIDEAHHTGATSWEKILNRFHGAKLLGVTATPQRLDGKGLGKPEGFYDKLILGPSTHELIELGYVSRPVVYAPPNDIDLTGVKKRFGDYAKGDLAFAVDKPKITGSCVEHYLRLCPDTPAIAFCASVDHSRHVSSEFNAAGVPSESLDGKMGDLDRKYRLEALGDGRIKVLTSVDVISEGLDVPIVTTAILLRPTASLSLYLQQVGRCLRTHPDKDHSIILDHVGNVFRHGLPDEDRTWSLNGDLSKAKRDTELLTITQCMKCYATFSVWKSECPECGYAKVVTPREIREVEGELKKITPDEKRESKRKESIQRRRDRGACKTLEELIDYGDKMGYKPGWAYFVWDARQDKKERVPA